MSRGASALPAPLADLLRDLDLDPATGRLVHAPVVGTAASDYLVLPSLARPQVLVPWVPAAGAMVADRRSRGATARLVRRVVATGLSSGLATRLPWRRLRVTDPALDELARWLTGEPDHRIGVLVGPPRANRKPVLRVLGPDGSTWGYAKLGVNPLTNRLVAAETAALGTVAALAVPGLRAPTVLAAGQWRGRQVLATSALAVGSTDRQPTALPVPPTRALFTQRAQHDVPLRAAPALALGGVPATQGGTPEAARVEDLAARLLDVVGDERIPLGAAHGDWTPWNMAWQGDTLEVWDWERFGTGVPQGLDVVHFEAARVRADAPEATEGAFLEGLPGRLVACGIDPALSRRLLAAYLVTIGRRYAADLAQQPARRLSLRLAWVLRLLAAEVSGLESEVGR